MIKRKQRENRERERERGREREPFDYVSFRKGYQKDKCFLFLNNQKKTKDYLLTTPVHAVAGS